MGMEMSSIEEMLKEGATLTLEPETAPELPVEEAKPIPKVYEEEQYLTDDEKKQVESFVKQIRLDDSNAILQYGSGTQKKMSAFSEGTLEKVRSKDLGEVGELLNGVVVELKGFDEEEEKGIKGFFKKKISKAQTLKLRYSKIEGNIDEICEKLEGHQVQLLKDSAMRQPHTLQTHTHCGSSKKRWEVFDLFSGSPLRAPCHPCRPYQYPKGADRTGNCPDAQTTAPSHCHSQNM